MSIFIFGEHLKLLVGHRNDRDRDERFENEKMIMGRISESTVVKRERAETRNE
jgi:hypothetical protein